MDENNCIERGAWLLIATIVGLLILVLTSCTRTMYVPITSVQHDSIYLHTHSRDSIMVHDSVTVMINGDTVWKERWRIEYRDRFHTDTIFIAVMDSVPVPYPVERKLSARERFYMGAGKVALPVAALCAALMIYRFRRRPT